MLNKILSTQDLALLFVVFFVVDLVFVEVSCFSENLVMHVMDGWKGRSSHTKVLRKCRFTHESTHFFIGKASILDFGHNQPTAMAVPRAPPTAAPTGPATKVPAMTDCPAASPMYHNSKAVGRKMSHIVASCFCSVFDEKWNRKIEKNE